MDSIVKLYRRILGRMGSSKFGCHIFALAALVVTAVKAAGAATVVKARAAVKEL